MNDTLCLCQIHIHRGAFLIAFYGFALSLLNVKTIIAIIFNVSNFVSPQSTQDDSLVEISSRAYFVFTKASDNEGLTYWNVSYFNVFISGFFCLLLAYGNRELRPPYYYPFIALCIHKMFFCFFELIECGIIILRRLPIIKIDHHASNNKFFICVGVILIVILFMWAYFMSVVLRAKSFMEKELLDPFTRLPRLANANLLTGINTPEVLPNMSSPNIPPPPFDWKPGDPIERPSIVPPAYQP